MKSEEEAEDVLKCPECGSTRLRQQEGDLVCQKCSTVVEEEVTDLSATERAFTAEEKEQKKRTGRPITYSKPGKGLRTEIGPLSKVSPEKRRQYYRLKKWDRRLDESKERRLKYALGEIERLASVLNLPDSVVEESSRLYEKALDGGVVKGRRIEHIVAALVYTTARNQGVPRTMKEISEKSGVSKVELGKTYRHVARQLDLRIVSISPQDLIPRYAKELDVSGEIQAEARRILSEAEEKAVSAGRSADGLAAVALYIAAKLKEEDLSQKEVADVTDVTTTTIRKGYQNLVKGLGLEGDLENEN
jgi:transcription initiation factor TFIIB